MESESSFRQAINKVSDWLNEQEWFGQLKGKWEELDPQSRIYLKAGGLGGTLVVLMFVVLGAVWSVHSLKSELADKTELLGNIQIANEELRRLREETSGAAAGGGGTGPWTAYFETVGTGAGMDKSTLSISAEKPGEVTDQAKETLFDLSLKHVNIKQVVRLAFGLENGSRPVKLRNLSIDTRNDPEGYMDATLAISAFALITK
jgi:hypothetical protein